MKWTKVTERIWRLKSWLMYPIIPIHVWLVKDETYGGWTLVDAGMKGIAPAVLRHIEELNEGPLRRIILTHGHTDHIGAIQPIVDATNAAVYAYAEEIPYMEGAKIYPRRKKAEFNVKPGLAQALPTDSAGKLLAIGGLQPYFAPGHSPGHVVYYHEQDDILLAGDLLTSNARGTKLKTPMAMFTGDMNQALESARIIDKLKPRQIEVCHGSAVSNPVAQLQAIFSS
ncbi:MBL fold metallo-hydrolase [Paenibacillus selenitireducens]|uniref:MBL fold metallo-hydrolase n=1 Tax=Paenibacillus selenitireducens TaxID=1324314 RepID=A0A1T2XAE3_9BACL|nr:MBL fold metallo-hydrolase [Paenibacillus selenitireducens]OPA76810.1 MBL fold metallo-hydrolase [Paenibacillus selenitireducens]